MCGAGAGGGRRRRGACIIFDEATCFAGHRRLKVMRGNEHYRESSDEDSWHGGGAWHIRFVGGISSKPARLWQREARQRGDIVVIDAASCNIFSQPLAWSARKNRKCHCRPQKSPVSIGAIISLAGVCRSRHGCEIWPRRALICCGTWQGRAGVGGGVLQSSDSERARGDGEKRPVARHFYTIIGVTRGSLVQNRALHI